jgi:endonuclease/exonuclease/phosphatase family metal-dependent hydrolase
MLKALTLNLNYYGEKYGTWPVRRGLIVDQIQESEPDLITFQAVKKDPNLFDGQDQATQIASMAGYPYFVYQPAAEYPDGSSEGSAILSQYPFSEVDTLPLSLSSDTEDKNQRVLMNCLCNFPSFSLRIFNAHFSWVTEQARDNIQEAYRYIHTSREPFLLLGDLNTTPDSNLLDLFRKAGMIDVWAKLCPDEDGFTFEADNPSIRIDYAWASQDLKKDLKAIQVVGEQRSTTQASFSDHLGLLIVLSVG